MSQQFNIYCDESCHLERDGQRAMVMGAVWCPVEKAREISVRLREIKAHHGLKLGFETKWTKVSPAKTQFYLDTIDYFFDDDDLHFRGLIVPEKAKLKHEAFNQTHDQWYYKMYFDLLKVVFDPAAHYRIYLDVKDTQGADKVAKLHEVLANAVYDFSREIVERVQLVRSHDIELMQITDLLIGALGYLNRGLASNGGKVALVERIKERSRYSLTRTTLLREQKVNLFYWQATPAP
jgi:hypothetical protein